MNGVFLTLSVVLCFGLSLQVNLHEFIVNKSPCDEVDNADAEKIAETFWKHAYCKEPLVIRKAAAAWPAIAKWTDEYYKSKSDEVGAAVQFDVEVGKKESRERKQTLKMSFGEFIDGYRDNDWYLVGNLPDFLHEDIEPPRFLANCSTGELAPKLFPAITLWLSSGGTKSHLHFDDMENFFCVLSGLKNVLLLNPVDGRSSVDINPTGLHSLLDVDSVDVEQYSQLKTKPFLETSLHAGDCLYIPYHWLHQIDSFDRSMALSFWFYPADLNKADCVDLFDELSGTVVATRQGVNALLNDIAREAGKTRDDHLSEQSFLNVTIAFVLPSNFSLSRQKVAEIKEILILFFRQLMDVDNSRLVSANELRRLSHSAITWLLHLRRQLTDDSFMAQCTEPPHFITRASSTSSHDEL